MCLRYCLVLIFLLAIASPSRAISEYPDSLSIQLSILSCEGWSASATAKSLAPTNLSSLDNSSISDDLLKEYQCQDREQRILQRGQRKIIIDAYQFATIDGAYGAYCAAHKGSSSYLSLGDASSEDQNSISLYKNKYFVYLHSSEFDDDEAKSAINKLAKQFIEHIDPSKNLQTTYGNNFPEIFNAMPRLERLSGSEKIAMGPVGLKRFFPAPYSVNLLPLVEAAIADYKLAEPDRDRLKLLIANYQSVEQANLVFDNYVRLLRSIHKEKPAEGYAYPAVLFKVSDYFLLCQIHNKRIIVISGARHKGSLSDLAHRIYL